MRPSWPREKKASSGRFSLLKKCRSISSRSSIPWLFDMYGCPWMKRSSSWLGPCFSLVPMHVAILCKKVASRKSRRVSGQTWEMKQQRSSSGSLLRHDDGCNENQSRPTGNRRRRSDCGAELRRTGMLCSQSTISGQQQISVISVKLPPFILPACGMQAILQKAHHNLRKWTWDFSYVYIHQKGPY